ncbi:MAG: MBL fold metallo-hydrolase [Planctomycetes bacterium]|nr:MBL fold metallo-hydrolase [Planctomycetota bacterium]
MVEIQHFYDPVTATLTYVVHAAGTAVLIDSVADYDGNAVRVTHESAEAVARYLDENELRLTHVLDTHVHADHLTAMPYFRARYGAKTVISANVSSVQRTFAKLLGMEDLVPDGSQFDVLLDDGAELDIGPFRIEAIPTHGHTPASLSFRIGDAVFVGDSLFQPDYGTARCDFPGGSAAEEYDSIMGLYALPPTTRVFTGHDYQPGGRELRFESTIAEQRATNKHLRDGVTKGEFVALRQQLEDGKPLPTLLFQALQINLRAGELPPAGPDGVAWLKLPIDAFATAGR